MTEAALSGSLEDYLEAIYHIVLEKQAARAKDIADRLNVHRSSVTNALRGLKERALINYSPYDIVTLTDKGRVLGADIVRRHETLRDFFVKVLTIDEEVAESAACQMEHGIPKQVLERFVQFVEYVETCPRGGSKWIKGFGYYCSQACHLDDCERCVEACLDDIRKAKRKNQAGAGKSVVSLGSLRPGDRARITKIKVKGALGERLRTMGITPGTLVQLERVAPLGDPVDIKVRGYHLSLRKEDLECIEAELLPVGPLMKEGE